jgi:hypothetical protein
VAGLPPPLPIRQEPLEDGRSVRGFLCDSIGLAGAADISALRGLLQHLRRKS